MGAANTAPGVLRNLRIKRVDLVDMGANFDLKTGDGSHIMLFKSAPTMSSIHVDSPEWDMADADDYEKRDLTGPGRRGLPDSAFAAVWTDSAGKKHRKLPIHDAGHLTAARGRLSQAQMPADVKARARRKIEAAGGKNKEKSAVDVKEMWASVLDLFRETDVAKRDAAIAEIEKKINPDEAPPPALRLHENHLAHLKRHQKDLGDMIKSYGDTADQMPYGHPVHEMKAMHGRLSEMLKQCMEPDSDDMNKRAKSDPPVPAPDGGDDDMDMETINKRFDALEKAIGVEKARADKAEAELKTAVDKAAALEETAKVEKKLRVEGEVRGVLKSFRATSIDVEKDLPKYVALKESSPEMFDHVIATLRTSDTAVAKSAWFKSEGSPMSGGGNTSDEAWAKIEAKADQLMEKSANSTMTREQAIDLIMKREPALVRQYRSQGDPTATH